MTFDNVEVHCQSKDTDLGVHVLNSRNIHYGWSFCENIMTSTLYFCHFNRQMVERTFDVFNITMASACDHGFSDTNTCNWAVKQDGFYFFDHRRSTWLKQYDWNQK
ncbi:Plant self-incompatibility S1 [Cynara cardunculus var. scolymus]|uniref:S-protein homolog n=1 Tax=Cynara cardunculus var. scolymus TaxID=59895 RepID=A0A103XHU4_CYNCS|nr:Plant self-incompatibility S1 [Cynara cardunculus var. scolymus]